MAFATVGCRLNRAETEAAGEEFLQRGWRVVEFNRPADLYFINTCTVTGRADRSSRQLIHRARRANPDAVVVAAGCFAARAAEELARSGEVDVVLGVEEKADPFAHLPPQGRPPEPIVRVSGAGEPLRAAVGTRVSGRSRAFLKVQDGCDHTCSYCAVRLVRGPSRSAPREEVLQALKRIAAAGFQEVVLTGVDLSAWGRDLESESGGLVSLVEDAAELGLPRVRLSSLEPWELTPERVRRLAAIPAWCGHLHLALQSADPEVLRRMGRPMDLARLREALAELLRLRPNATIGADLIAGFPGESEEAFHRTLAFLDEGPLHYLHVFPFSPRPGTRAAELRETVPPEIVTRRAGVLRREGLRRRRVHYADAEGRTAEIVIEQDGRTGYTREYLRARLAGPPRPPRARVNVRLLHFAVKDNLLTAEVTG